MIFILPILSFFDLHKINIFSFIPKKNFIIYKINGKVSNTPAPPATPRGIIKLNDAAEFGEKINFILISRPESGFDFASNQRPPDWTDRL
jgi:hypothetical protein